MGFTCTYESVNYQEIKRVIFVVSKIFVALLIMIYFGAELVICNEEIPFCNDRLKKLREEEKNWREKCLHYEGQELNSSCCEAEKRYNQERTCTHTRMCFYKGNDWTMVFHNSFLTL